MVSLIKNKKAIDYSFLLVIVVIIVLVSLFIAIYTISDRHDFKLGETQAALLNSFYYSESMLLFVDQAAKYSTYNALYELENIDKECGKLNNVNLFNKKENPTEICFFDTQEMFKRLLNQNLNNYFSQYSKYDVPQDNYEFLLLNNSLKGIALEPVYIGIFMPKRKTELRFLGIKFKEFNFLSYQFGRYFIKPSFSLDIKHNLFFYDVLQQELNQTINNCAFKFNQTDVSKKIFCINNKLSDMYFKVQTDDNETFIFEFPQNITNPFETKDLNIKMAAYIPSIEIKI